MLTIDNKPLTAEEHTTIDHFDSVVAEKFASARVNAWVVIKIAKSVRKKVIAVLQARIESRGRQVGVFQESDHWRLDFPPPVAALPPLQALTASAAHHQIQHVAETSGAKVLVRMPTRDRPAQALHALTAYRNLAGYPVTLEVVVDCDDEKMLSSEVLQRLCALDVVVTVGEHRSKVEAVNGGRVAEWDILILASDDMVPVVDGYAKIIVEEMSKHFPHFDGAIYFPDGYSDVRCCTMPVIGRHLYDQFYYIYDQEYRSLCCDVEQTEVLRAMKRLVYIDKTIIEHRHPAIGKAPSDALYARNEEARGVDQQTYERRRDARRPYAQFGFDAPPLALSICIVTLPERRQQLDRLIAYIYGQIVRDAPRQVEVIVDDGPGEIGAKRQHLIERALGHYVAHIDDDDWISYDYVKRIVGAITASSYAVDCVALSGVITTNGGSATPFHHSIRYREWHTDGEGVHYRSPNHLNPCRRDLALKAGFPVEISHGEDHEFSKRLLPFLSREAVLVGGPLYYYWFRSEK